MKIIIVNMNCVFDTCLSTRWSHIKEFPVKRGPLFSKLPPKGTEQTESVTMENNKLSSTKSDDLWKRLTKKGLYFSQNGTSLAYRLFSSSNVKMLGMVWRTKDDKYSLDYSKNILLLICFKNQNGSVGKTCDEDKICLFERRSPRRDT